MSVSTDEPTIKTDIASLECGNSRKLGADEVGFYKSVLLVKNTEYVKLDLILALTVKRGRAAGKKIERLAADCGAERTGVLVCRIRNRTCRKS